MKRLLLGSIGKFPENDGFLAVITSNVDENQKKNSTQSFFMFPQVVESDFSEKSQKKYNPPPKNRDLSHGY